MVGWQCRALHSSADGALLTSQRGSGTPAVLHSLPTQTPVGIMPPSQQPTLEPLSALICPSSLSAPHLPLIRPSSSSAPHPALILICPSYPLICPSYPLICPSSSSALIWPSSAPYLPLISPHLPLILICLSSAPHLALIWPWSVRGLLLIGDECAPQAGAVIQNTVVSSCTTCSSTHLRGISALTDCPPQSRVSDLLTV